MTNCLADICENSKIMQTYSTRKLAAKLIKHKNIHFYRQTQTTVELIKCSCSLSRCCRKL